MKERKKTLDESADLFGISHSMLQVYLKADDNPSIKTLEYMADKFGINVFDLIGAPPREEYVSLRDILETLAKVYRNLFVYLLSMKLLTREPEGGSERIVPGVSKRSPGDYIICIMLDLTLMDVHGKRGCDTKDRNSFFTIFVMAINLYLRLIAGMFSCLHWNIRIQTRYKTCGKV